MNGSDLAVYVDEATGDIVVTRPQHITDVEWARRKAAINRWFVEEVARTETDEANSESV